MNDLIARIVKSRKKYLEDRNPQAEHVNKLENAINSGRYHDDELIGAVGRGMLVRGNASYYVQLT